MIYVFDFTDNICYISSYDGDETKELPACPCPIEIEERMAFINDYRKDTQDAAVITVETLTKELVDAVEKEKNLTFLSKEEAFVEYVLQNEKGVWQRNTAVFEFHKGSFCFYAAGRRGKTIMTEKEDIMLPEKGLNSAREKDKFFTKWVAEKLNHRQISTVYLIGEEFEGEWMELSLASVCHGRRVFMGNHLFSTGAMLWKAKPLEKKDKVMTGDYHPYYWGIRAFHQGKKDVFVPIIQPGSLWFHTEGRIDVLMDECEELEIEGMHSISRQEMKLTMPLGLRQEHPTRTSKYRITMRCTGTKGMVAAVYDIGFGASRKGTGLIYQEEFKLP